ncbi:MAG: DUF3810 domain-containing protein [Chitinophagaceae bacterium]|nr:MAG: DUF3810 domain-containing protein [Chitinophagaceae bacterium]
MARNPALVLLILLAVAVKWAAFYPGFVETWYTYGLYPLVARIMRVLLGWLPFSAGDLFYGFVVLVLLFRVVRFFRLLFRRELSRAYFLLALRRTLFVVLLVYVSFNLLWGLNYNRQGIARQLDLEVRQYRTGELDTLTRILQGYLNYYAAGVTEPGRDEFDRKRRLFAEAVATYDRAALTHPFLHYRSPSVKPSIFSYLGNYLGFQGYYNPFSGEAQVNTTVPRFLEPFVTTHEIGHQLGYAKENEANFIGFLASRHSSSPVVLYSMYFDMYSYAATELYRRDSIRARQSSLALHTQVKKDITAMREFQRSHRNPVERFVSWGYGNYLKANNQPSGKMSYNEVVGWMIAWYRKNGAGALAPANPVAP